MRAMRLLAVGALLLTVLGAIPRAEAFVTTYSLRNDDATFTFAIGVEPQWTLESGSDTYRGRSFDTAKFTGHFGMSFGDAKDILLNDEPVQAKLKGKIAPDCSWARIKLTDLTNARKIVLTEPFGGGIERLCDAP